MNVLNSLKALLFASSNGTKKGAGSGTMPDFAQLLGAAEAKGTAPVAEPGALVSPAMTGGAAVEAGPVTPAFADLVTPGLNTSPALVIESLPKGGARPSDAAHGSAGQSVSAVAQDASANLPIESLPTSGAAPSRADGVEAPVVPDDGAETSEAGLVSTGQGDMPVAQGATEVPAEALMPEAALARPVEVASGAGKPAIDTISAAMVVAKVAPVTPVVSMDKPVDADADGADIDKADAAPDDGSSAVADGNPAILPPVVAPAIVIPPMVAPVVVAVDAPVADGAAPPLVTAGPAMANLAKDQPKESVARAEPAAIAPAPVKADAAGTPVARGEALSLLQLFQEHMKSRSVRTEDSAAPAATAATPDAASPADLAMPSIMRSDAPSPVAHSVPTAVIQTPGAITPTVDLSASLGAQVVDMGVSGQWIDGLARDIAGLSANGAQGRFQISTDTLGPIQVDIRQGEAGASVSLTVATDMAEKALRQDSDRLRLDAGLAAVRITDVKVERAPHVAETSRQEATSNNGSQQQQGQGQSQAQAQGQAMGQSSSQGRWQSRENIASSHKAGQDAVVLHHADTGDSSREAVRARYA